MNLLRTQRMASWVDSGTSLINCFPMIIKVHRTWMLLKKAMGFFTRSCRDIVRDGPQQEIVIKCIPLSYWLPFILELSAYNSCTLVFRKRNHVLFNSLFQQCGVGVILINVEVSSTIFECIIALDETEQGTIQRQNVSPKVILSKEDKIRQ